MKTERYVEIVTPSYIYKGRMTQTELLKEARDRVLRIDDVTIAGLVMYGWDEVDMMWATTLEPEPHFLDCSVKISC